MASEGFHIISYRMLQRQHNKVPQLREKHNHMHTQSQKALRKIAMSVGWVSDFATLHFCVDLLGGVRDAGGPYYNYIVLHNIKKYRRVGTVLPHRLKRGGPWTGYMILDILDVKPFGDNGGGDVAIPAGSPNSPVCEGRNGAVDVARSRVAICARKKQEDPLDPKNGRARRDVTMRRRHKAQHTARECAHLAPSMPHVRRDRWLPGAHPDTAQPTQLHLTREPVRTAFSITTD